MLISMVYFALLCHTICLQVLYIIMCDFLCSFQKKILMYHNSKKGFMKPTYIFLDKIFKSNPIKK